MYSSSPRGLDLLSVYVQRVDQGPFLFAGKEEGGKVEKKDVAEVAGKELVKTRRKGNGKNSPVIGDNGVKPIKKEENARYCALALDLFHAPEVDINDPESVDDAITNYFQNCIDKGLRPGNLGLYTALGLSKQEVSNAIHGVGKKLNPAVVDLIKKAKRVMGTYREILGSEGKLNPSTLIFWQKNYDGLKDMQDITITPNIGMEADSTPEQIEADIPIDVEAEEL